MLKILRSICADLGAGLLEIASVAVRVTTRGISAAFGFFGRRSKGGPRLPTRPRSWAFRLPGWRFLGLAAASLVVWTGIAVLALNIRMAAMVIPETVGDLYAANRPAGMTIMDRQGDVIGSRGARFGDPVEVGDLPPILIDAIISTEDRRFYRHAGFDTRGLLRAVVTNLRAGGVVEGGSTITQQLAKNLFLSPDKTLLRKLEEIQLAMWLEARFSKEEILRLYVNRIYMGAGAYGIEAAANAYFSKPATELTDAEAVLLAGLPQAPSSYAPTTNWEAAIERSYVVIDNLVEVGRLSATEALALKANPPVLNASAMSPGHGYFLDHVVAELTERLGEITEDVIITTTLDSRLQAAAKTAVEEIMAEVDPATGAEQAALIAYDANGAVVAMVGGTDYQASQFNRATQAMRQPGSAFKPFVFLAALESGLNAETVVVDQPIRVGKWQPTNYTDRHQGPMRLSTAAAKSTNTVAVQVTEAIGRDRVIDAARRAGIETRIDPLPSLALGAMEITLEELTAAYMVFAHSGAERPAHAITSVRTRNGVELGTFSQAIDGFQIIEGAHADETARMLLQVVRNGTGKRAALPDWQVAGKTGTTNDWRDAWFVGFTADLTAGVWVGNDRSAPMDEITGGSLPLDIWHRFMTMAHADRTPRPVLTDDLVLLEDVGRLGSYYAGLRSDLIDAMFGPPAMNEDWGQPVQVQGRPAGQDDGQPAPRIVGRAAPGAAIDPETP